MGALFDAVRAGDRAAIAEIERLVRTSAQKLCRGGGPTGTSDLDWENIAREIERQLLDVGIERYTGDGSESDYIYDLVRARVIRRSRRDRRRRSREAGASAPQLETARILERIPPDCRRLITQILFDDTSYADLAREADMEESEIRANLSRCIRRAREAATGDPS